MAHAGDWFIEHDKFGTAGNRYSKFEGALLCVG
jgi:hypothetical protein